MKKGFKKISAYVLTIILLATSCVLPTCAFAGSRVVDDIANEGYRYLINTEFYYSTTSLVNTRSVTNYRNRGNRGQTITRNLSGPNVSWSTSIGAYATASDLYNKPSDYNVSSACKGSVTAYVPAGRMAIFIAYYQKTVWRWKHTRLHQHKKANSAEWETIDTETSVSDITKYFTTFGSRIQ